jgi:hypothetical protein
MEQLERAPVANVIDDGTGVYFWDGVELSRALLGKEWVFMGRFRCEGCGRSVTIVRFERDDDRDRLFRRQKQCPGGCDAVHEWLAAAAIESI